MEILFISPEVFPFARAGGLGDVSHFLPRALSQQGHHLSIITPKYRWTESAGYDLAPVGTTISVPLAWREKTARIFQTRVEGEIDVFFVGCDELYNREGLYGNEFGDYEDNAERFIFFCRAVMEMIQPLGLTPDLIHCHDWPTGLIPAYAKSLYKDVPNLKNTSTLFTFHNLGSQGIFWHFDFAMTGLPWELFTPEGLEFHGQLNMTKAGLIFSDLISTVSRKYSQEVLTCDYAFGLEGVLRSRADKTHAVLNGVDYRLWDPAVDPVLAANYTMDQIEKKLICRDNLLENFGLARDERPIVAVISRLLDRKGFDLISACLDRILELPMKMVFMGMGEDKYHVMLRELATAHPDRVSLTVAYDKDLAHRIMAGADLFLMPSRYEPCGLEQLYALKYGTVPVVRATGGLDDTVVDVATHPTSGTGFKFHDYSPDALFNTLSGAVHFFENRTAWRELMRRGMGLDFSWKKSAAEYEKLYHLTVEEARRAS